MTQLLVFNAADPCIGISFRTGPYRGYAGTCTECGKPMHFWTEERAFRLGQEHVDSHAPVLIGGDTDSVVFNPLCP
jgi:hypothetical protein